MARSATSRRETVSTVPTPWPHQKQTTSFFSRTPIGFDFSDPGCVSADTEFLTPAGWKRIDQWVRSDLVAQFHPKSRTIEFVIPSAYVKRPCEQFIAIAPIRGMSQRISHEHRVLYYKNGKPAVCSGAEFMEGLHKHGANHFKRKFCSTFSVRNKTKLDLSAAEIRVMIAVIADGHYPEDSAKCSLRLKKQRKVLRLRELLDLAGIEYTERTCGGDPDFQVFRFVPPAREKEFGSGWWGASQAQLEIIASELPHWDSAIDPRPSKGVRFSSFSEASANFAQYAFAAAKKPASLHVSVRDRTDTDRGVMTEYYVHASEREFFPGPGRASSVYEVPSEDGYKYCFEVPSSFLLLRHNGYIFATGNTGKSRAHLDVYGRRSAPGRLLVVCPKTLMYSAWACDIEKFASGLTFSLAYAENRAEAFELKTDVVIINTDGVKWLADNPRHLKNFDHVVIDESTAFKHRTSQRSKAAKKICRMLKHRYGLTGTPNANSVTEIWHQAMLIDGGKRLGDNFFHFRNIMQTPTQVGPSPDHLRWDDRPGAQQAVSELLADITVRHRFEDVMTHVPANHRDSKAFELNKKLRAVYDRLEQDAIVMLQDKSITAVHAAALRTKLLQTASGAIYTGGEDGNYQLIDTQRYDLVADLIEGREHSVVAFNWRHQRDYLCKTLEARDIRFAVIDGSVPQRERDEIVRQYQEGRYQTILMHPRTGAHGLTLTRGDTTIIASPLYEADLLKQFIHRIYRGAQDKVTNTIFVRAANTVEELVYGRLDQKEHNMNDLLELLQTRRNA